MCGSMVDIQSAAAEIRRGIKKEDRKKSQSKNIMSASATQGGHKYHYDLLLTAIFMGALRSTCGHCILQLWLLSSFFFFFPRLFSAVGDWMSTILPHMVWP